MIANIIIALRAPFLTASVFPFVFGSLILIKTKSFNLQGFLLGLLAVISTHLSANLINDYADSKSGADWQDMYAYGFFGGSKLIQKKIFSEQFYLNAAVFCSVTAILSVVFLSVILKTFIAIILFSSIFLLAWAYSLKPFQFAYCKAGEIIIFFLFGPALVMGGYFIQSKIFPDFKSFMLSLPLGILTCAILYANEVPDFFGDKAVGKINWVGLLGQKNAYLGYYLLMVLAFSSIVLNLCFGFIGVWSLLSFTAIFPALKAAGVLKKHFQDKIKLVESSKSTILTHTIVSIVLIIAAIL